MSLFLPDSHLKKSSTFFLREDAFPDPNNWTSGCQYFSSFPEIADVVGSQKGSAEALIVNRNKRICLIFIGLLILLMCLIAGVCFSSLSVLQFNGLAFGLALAIPLVLGIGGLLIFLRAGCKIDIFTHRPLGINPGRPVFISDIGMHINSSNVDHNFEISCSPWYLDSSGLDENGNGVAGAYICPPVSKLQKFAIIFGAFTYMPLFVSGIMIYQLFRSLIIPFYIFFKMIQERRSTVEDKFKLADIPREILRSLFNVIKAPFYGVGMIFSLLYSLMEPYSGRILTGAIERSWNDEILCDNGFMLLFCERNRSLWRWEGGGKRSLLGRNALYMMVCCQPRFLFLFKQGRIVSGSRTIIAQPNGTFESNVYAWNCISESLDLSI